MSVYYPGLHNGYPLKSSKKAIEVLAKNGKSFHFAGRFLNSGQFRDCARLYRFCRFLDDTVDGAKDIVQARERIQILQNDLSCLNSDIPEVVDFISLARRDQFSLAPVTELLRGLADDLEEVRVADDAELKRYCYRVAGTVGLLMCGVLGVRDPSAFPHAIDLGIAMQLTNIARDIREDALAGRRYLPAEKTGDLSPAEIVSAEHEVRMRLQSAARRLLVEADRYYHSGEAGLAFLPLRARLAILVAARVYRAIGGVLARGGYKTWLGRATVSKPRKLVIAARAVVEFLVNPKFHRPPTHHDNTLHRHLQGLPGSYPP